MIRFYKEVRSDLNAVISRDPSINNRVFVFLFWSGFHAIFFYRIYSRIWKIKPLRIFAYFLWRVSYIINTVDIHPGAKIGKGCFIDHAMGVVIGATSIIGEDVTIYHGVTLGALKPFKDARDQENIKRHPTIGNNVVIGSGATILGDITISDKKLVSANSVITKDM